MVRLSVVGFAFDILPASPARRGPRVLSRSQALRPRRQTLRVAARLHHLAPLSIDEGLQIGPDAATDAAPALHATDIGARDRHDARRLPHGLHVTNSLRIRPT